jgi:two-component system, cell cycle sensor histidine kinase and response regulator CckA
MTQARILIVEDERVVARDIQNRLDRLGYAVVGTGRSGEDAIDLAGRLRPDLILMDIRLQGALDGVAAAHQIRARWRLPVVYLTAYADQGTLERARVTEPYGYVLKPFDERELHTAIEMALYKHHAEERFRSVFETAMIGMAIADQDGRLLQVNLSFERMVGYTAAELHGMSLFDLTHPDDRPSARGAAEDILAGRREAHHHEARYLHKAGTLVWAHITNSVIRHSDASPRFLVEMAVDVTERKLLEEQFRQAQKMEAVGRLAGGVAHDFNNLLTVINNCAAMLFRELRPSDRVAELLTEIQRAGERAAALTRHLLVFSRKQSFEPQVTDLNELVDDLAPMLRWLLGEHIELIIITAPDLGLVKVDLTQFEQVLMNLAVNARDAMPRSGSLTIETRNIDLTVAYAQAHPGVRPGRYATVAVTDTGHGMDEATKARIFEPFFTTKAEDQGTGLGLSLVHGVVRQSGGHIEVSSEVDRGATFTIRLPVVEEGA